MSAYNKNSPNLVSSRPSMFSFRVCSVLKILLAALPLLTSCSATNRLLKAKPTSLSGSFDQPTLAMDSRKQLPFQKVWITPDRRVEAAAVVKSKLYIAPVSLAQLRPLKKPLVRNEVYAGSIVRNEAGMAYQLRQEFGRAFYQSPRPRYKVVSKTGADTLTLQLSIVELNPTSPKGNVVKTALKFMVGPIAGLAGYFTKGNMAIEGKVLDSKTGKVFFQFADNEADKMTFYSLRDYKPYGHAVYAMRDWADEFELMTRTPPGEKIKDTRFITLRPY
jgi:Protein of unknown function (DUF3313)